MQARRVKQKIDRCLRPRKTLQTVIGPIVSLPSWLCGVVLGEYWLVLLVAVGPKIQVVGSTFSLSLEP